MSDAAAFRQRTIGYEANSIGQQNATFHRSMDDLLLQYVPNVHFEQIPIKNLTSNQEYQRNLSIKHVQKAAENFDLYQINPIKVSRRDGKNYVFNGQHTIEIIATVSGSRETPVWCMIYDDLVESFGLEIAASSGPGGICAVSTLEYIYDKYGFRMLDHVLTLCIGTWEGSPSSLSGNMLKAVARILYVYGDNVKDDMFKEKLGKVSMKEITRTARERREGSLGYAETLLIHYNKKMRNQLRMEYLYNKKPSQPNYIEDSRPESRESNLSDGSPSPDFEPGNAGQLGLFNND